MSLRVTHDSCNIFDDDDEEQLEEEYVVEQLSNTIIAIAMRRVTPSYGVPMRPVGRAVKRLKVRECVTLRIP